jgi:8-oxo-dGTP diphosphatase
MDLHSVSVAAVVCNKAGQLLLIRRRDSGAWQIPGGQLRLGETIIEGLRREVLEETGYSVSARILTGVYKNIIEDVLALVFLCDVTDGYARTSSETSAVEWFDVDKMAELVEPSFSIRILDALRYHTCPAVRTHDGTREL